MTNQLARTEPNAAIMEQVVIGGDLSNLTPQQRVNYYSQVCESVGLNPLTKPFDYLKLSGRLVLYARKDATEQLRNLHGISVGKPELQFVDDLLIVSVSASDNEGRTDADIGVVTIGNLKGDAKANAIMKAVTKAKRRVTLSIAGLGWLDETEIETIPNAQRVDVTVDGEIVNGNPRVTDDVPFDPLPFDLQVVIEAGQMTTPKGTRLMDLEPDQLSMVVDKSKGTLGDAAELLLNLATEAALAALVEVGGDPLPETTTNLELVNAYYALDQA